MAETKQATGIILRRSDFREYDSRILVYTLEHGLLDLVVRGTKRPRSKMAGHIEPLNLANLMIAPGKHYDYAAAVVATHTWPQVKNDYLCNVIAQKASAHLARILKPGICDRELLKQLADLLFTLPVARHQDIDYWVSLFKIKTLSHLGFRPRLSACAQCGGAIGPKAEFNFADSTLYCSSCASHYHSLTLSPELVKLLQDILKHEYKILANFKINSPLSKELKNFTDKYQQWLL